MGANNSHQLQGVVTRGNNIYRKGAGLARSLVVRVHAGVSSFEATSQRRAEQRRDKPGLAGKAGAENWQSSKIYHATEIVYSIHCQIIVCYDLNE